VAHAHIAKPRDFPKSHIEVGQPNASYLNQVAVHRAHVLDVGKVDLAGEVDIFPNSAIGPQPGTPKEGAVEHGLVGRIANQNIVALIKPRIVELKAASEMNAKSVVLGFRDEAVVPLRGQRAIFPHFGRLWGWLRLCSGRRLSFFGLDLFASGLLLSLRNATRARWLLR
jgi:hypothetical protein